MVQNILVNIRIHMVWREGRELSLLLLVSVSKIYRIVPTNCTELHTLIGGRSSERSKKLYNNESIKCI
jgi:hypothetical protein